jgi:hypothetical protein
MITIQEVRAKYPQYQDLSDKQLVDSLHQKYYSDIPINQFYQQVGPQTVPGEYAETIGEFTAPGGIFARTAKGLGQAAIIGTGAGAVQETAEQFDAPVWAQVPLTLTTALALGYATAPSRAAKIANEALKGVDDAELAIAMQMEEGLKAKGYTITAPELIDNKIVQKLGVDIYGTEKGGQIMYNYLKERPEQLKIYLKIYLMKFLKNQNI